MGELFLSVQLWRAPCGYGIPAAAPSQRFPGKLRPRPAMPSRVFRVRHTEPVGTPPAGVAGRPAFSSPQRMRRRLAAFHLSRYPGSNIFGVAHQLTEPREAGKRDAAFLNPPVLSG